MVKYLRKTTAFILTAMIILSCTFVGLTSAAQETAQDTQFPVCDGNCGYSPTIVIPGIFQSQSRMYDEDGNMVLDADGDPLTQLMVNLSKNDIIKLVFKCIAPVISSLVLQQDVGLSSIVASAVSDILSGNAKDTNGNHINNVGVIKYKQSVATLDQAGKDYVYKTIPLKGYSQIAGEDHLYFFTYDSFGSVLDIADELYDYIQQVKEETGHSKVNLVPISQGGSIANALFELYKDEGIANDLNRVVYIIPALDGSMLISKIMSDGFVKSDDMLYGRLFPALLESDQEWMAYLINIALRILPKDVVYSVIDKTVEALANTLLVNSTCMWALTASEDYDKMVDMYLSDGEHDVIKAQTDIFHQAQVNRVANILAMKASGVKFFDVVNYDYPFYPLFEGWEDVNADGIINVASESLGAISAPVGQALPADYVEDGTYGTSTAEHSYISPDRTIYATAGALCDTTFYFKGQDHEKTGHNDVIMKLAIALLTDKNFTSVRSYPNKFPQFNTGRSSGEMEGTLSFAKTIDQSALSEEDKTELNAAIAACDAQMATTVVDIEAFTAAQDRLINILVKIGKRVPAEKESEGMVVLTKVLKFISNALYIYVGPRGFSDVLLFRHTSWDLPDGYGQ